jgi:hypothetical protein
LVGSLCPVVAIDGERAERVAVIKQLQLESKPSVKGKRGAVPGRKAETPAGSLLTTLALFFVYLAREKKGRAERNEVILGTRGHQFESDLPHWTG